MRKLHHFLVITVFLLCLVPQTCLAIMYANGDANYPIWNTGNRGGSAFDLSSCVITRDTDSELVICAFNYHLTYTAGDGRTYENGDLEPRGYVNFSEDKRSGTVSVLASTMRQPQKVSPNSPEQEAFDLMKRQVGRM